MICEGRSTACVHAHPLIAGNTEVVRFGFESGQDSIHVGNVLVTSVIQ